MFRKENKKNRQVGLQEDTNEIRGNLNEILRLNKDMHEQHCTAYIKLVEMLEEKLGKLSKHAEEQESAQKKLEEMLKEELGELSKHAEEQEKVQNERYNKIHYCNVASIALLFAVIAMFIFQCLKINALTNQIAECENQIAECETLITNQVSDDAEARFLEAVLPMGNFKMKDVSKNKYYYDRDCQYEIVNPVFSIKQSDYVMGEDSEGNPVKIYRLTDGSFAYSEGKYTPEFESIN